MKYFVVFDQSVTTGDRKQRVVDADDQRKRIRLALTAGFSDDDPTITLWEEKDLSPYDNETERQFAKRIENSVKPSDEANHPGDCTIVAIGDGARFALDSLAELAKLSSKSLSQRIYSPLVQLILIAPRVSSREFLETADALACGTLVSRVSRRIVVIYSDAASPGAINAGLNGRLGLWGPAGKCFENVLSLDVSMLALGHLPGINAYLGSLEVLGLVGRAVNGASDGTLRRMAARGAASEPSKT